MEAFEADLLADTDDAVIVTDASGVIRYYNRAAETMFGHPRDQAVGASLDLIVPERLRTRHWDGFHQAVTSGTTSYTGRLLAVPAMRADGTRISVEFTVTLLFDGAGAVRGVGAILRDVTARREEQQALRQRLEQLEDQLAARG